jgi:hydrogenase maturation protease
MCKNVETQKLASLRSDKNMKTLVVGLGNPILTDDGVGVQAAWELARLLHGRNGNGRTNLTAVMDGLQAEFDGPASAITVTEASVGGLRLMELMIGFDRVILIDALMVKNGRGVGSIHRLALDDLAEISPTQHIASAHDTTLITALESGRQLGFHLPDEVIVYAVEVENVQDFSDEPTTAVAAAIPKVVTAVLAELQISNVVTRNS